jgi:hypothetical protein
MLIAYLYLQGVHTVRHCPFPEKYAGKSEII